MAMKSFIIEIYLCILSHVYFTQTEPQRARLTATAVLLVSVFRDSVQFIQFICFFALRPGL
jgi:hypothetical protein